MAAKAQAGGISLSHNVFFLFAAGAISLLVFQMATWTILNLTGLAPGAFPMGATKPLGVPQTWSLAFWGGVWGIVFGAVEKYFPKEQMYWVAAFLFGAIFPSLFLWFIVFPLKGIPMAAGWDAGRMGTHVLNHGAWGLGTALLLRWRP